VADATVKQFAEVLNVQIERLLAQFRDAGIDRKSAEDIVSEEEKRKLLAHLRQMHGKNESGSPKKITLKRKTISEVRMPGAQGKKTVSVEVRKKRTYVKRTPQEEPKTVGQAVNTPENPKQTPGATQQATTPPATATKTSASIIVAAEPKAQAATTRVEQPPQQTQTVPVEQTTLSDTATSAVEVNVSKPVVEAPTDKETSPVVQSSQQSSLRVDSVNSAPQVREAASAKEGKARDFRPKPAHKSSSSAAPKREEKKPFSSNHNKNEKTEVKAKPQDNKPKREVEDSKNPAKAKKNLRPSKESKEREEKDKKAVKPQKFSKRAVLVGDDEDDSGKRRGGPKRRKESKAKQPEHGFTMPTAPMVREVKIPETISVAELAQKMSIKGSEVVGKLFQMGTPVTLNQIIDQDTAIILVEEMGHKAIPLNENELETELMAVVPEEGEEVSRAPVVTIMGHVDHGKTSLLDHIRRTRVAAGEAGGITQHIGAYHVQTEKGMITFLDTPGHEAFTAMRARGAKLTDIVVLVVAADDGVMPRTVEAIQHARAAKVPIVVAVNKIDKPEANPEKVRQELSQYEVMPEEWGGENMFVDVSAKQGLGIDHLLDTILLQAEVLELKTVASGPAKGIVIESHLDRGLGPVATILVQRGTLQRGDMVLTGQEYGRVRKLMDENRVSIQAAGPSIPVEILGLSGVPNPGEEAMVVAEERKARELALFRQGKFREVKLASRQKAKLENLFSDMEAGERATLNIVLKADMNGSQEALRESLEKLSSNEVQVRIISAGVGGITESDVTLAMASEAIIVAFNVRADASAKRLIAEESVDIHYYSVIYDVIDEVKKAISGMLAPEIREQFIGLAEVREVFRSSKLGAIAGCMVIEGVVKRHNPIRILRNNVVIYEGELESLRRFKDDVNEVKAGTECGIGVKNYNDVQPKDHIEVFEHIKVARSA